MKVVSDQHTVSSNIYCIDTKNGWIPCPSLIINHAPTTLYPIQIRTLLSFSSSFSRPHERIHFLPQYNNYNMGNLHTTLKPLRSQPRTDVSMIEIPWRLLWSLSPPNNPQKPLKNPSEKQAIKVRWLWYLIADDLHHEANNLTGVTVKLSKGCQQLFCFWLETPRLWISWNFGGFFRLFTWDLQGFAHWHPKGLSSAPVDPRLAPRASALASALKPGIPTDLTENYCEALLHALKGIGTS